MQSSFLLMRPTHLAAAHADAAAALRSAPLRMEVDGLPAVAARLAIGDFEAVRSLLLDAAPAPALPINAARYLAWSGDLHTVIGAFAAVRSSLSLLDQHADVTLQLATCAALQRTATDVGDAELAARLVARARTLAAGSSGSDSGSGLSDGERAAADAASGLILDVAQRLLGLDPDATRARLRLRPRINADDALEAHAIRFADGAVSLHVHRSDDTVVYRVEQDAGALPFTVLLEPIVANVVSACVDGQPADLAFTPAAGGIMVPVQLVLDDARTLVVRTAPV